MEQSAAPEMPENPKSNGAESGETAKALAALSSPETAPREDRNWLPVLVAGAAALAVIAVMLLLGRSRNHTQDLSNLPSAPDAYAARLRVSNVTMSESSNLAGGKITYLDGQISNLGDKTVSEAIVEVTFRDYANKVAQSQRLPLTIIRMREPYIDTSPLSAAPLRPGTQTDFRLNFDSVSPDWAGNTPEIQVLRVVTQ
jgi:hypothetical protein